MRISEADFMPLHHSNTTRRDNRLFVGKPRETARCTLHAHETTLRSDSSSQSATRKNLNVSTANEAPSHADTKQIQRTMSQTDVALDMKLIRT
jgi:hypothetical protein